MVMCKPGVNSTLVSIQNSLHIHLQMAQYLYGSRHSTKLRISLHPWGRASKIPPIKDIHLRNENIDKSCDLASRCKSVGGAAGNEHFKTSLLEAVGAGEHCW